jgi:hypothetical protein
MAWSDEHQGFVVKEFIQNGGSPIMTQRAFRVRFALWRRDPVPDKKFTIGCQIQTYRFCIKKEIYWPTSDRNKTGNCGCCESFD